VLSKKKEIRKELLKKRLSLSDGDYDAFNEAIRQTVLTSEVIQKAETIHCYASINVRKEVNTFPLIQYFLDSGKRVIVPVMDLSTTTLIHSELQSLSDLKINNWGVPEPDEIKSVSFQQADVIIVPMVGADEQLNRLGYGKGYYDRFLSESVSPKIGLIFENCVIEQLPVEKHDEKMSMIITEKRIIL